MKGLLLFAAGAAYVLLELPGVAEARAKLAELRGNKAVPIGPAVTTGQAPADSTLYAPAVTYV